MKKNRLREQYEEVRIVRWRNGKCPCGKRHRSSKSFQQTINPYNCINGRRKNKEEIIQELEIEAEKWVNDPVHCRIPTYWEWTKEQRGKYDNNADVAINAICGTEVIVRRRT